MDNAAPDATRNKAGTDSAREMSRPENTPGIVFLVLVNHGNPQALGHLRHAFPTTQIPGEDGCSDCNKIGHIHPDFKQLLDGGDGARPQQM